MVLVQFTSGGKHFGCRTGFILVYGTLCGVLDDKLGQAFMNEEVFEWKRCRRKRLCLVYSGI